MTQAPSLPESTKVVLTKGTSSGIGLSVAVAAGRAGWRTVATMRDLSSARSG